MKGDPDRIRQNFNHASITAIAPSGTPYSCPCLCSVENGVYYRSRPYIIP